MLLGRWEPHHHFCWNSLLRSSLWLRKVPPREHSCLQCQVTQRKPELLEPALLWPGLFPPTPTEQEGTSHQTPGRRWERPRLPEATPLRTESRPLRVTSELGRCPRRARPSLIRHSSSPFHNDFRVKSRFLPSPARNPPSLPVGSPQLRRLEPAMT